MVIEEVMDNPRATTALLKACAKEDAVGMREALREGAAPNASLDGYPPLMLAALMGDEALVNDLLKAGANVHARDGNEGATVLYFLAASGRTEAHGRIMKRLIEAGADINAQSPGTHGSAGSTPLQVAVQLKNVLAANILDEHFARATHALRAALRKLQSGTNRSAGR